MPLEITQRLFFRELIYLTEACDFRISNENNFRFFKIQENTKVRYNKSASQSKCCDAEWSHTAGGLCLQYPENPQDGSISLETLALAAKR